MSSHVTRSNPTPHTQKTSQEPSFPVHQNIENRIQQSHKESQVQEKPASRQEALRLPVQQVTEGRRVVQGNESSKENRPHENGVDQYVDGVTVIGAIEGEVFLEIEQPFSHRWRSIRLESERKELLGDWDGDKREPKLGI